MKVALVNSRIESRQDLPHALLQLAACVEDICDVRIFDPDPNVMFFEDIGYWRPDIVGVSSMTMNYERSKYIIKTLKSFLPKTKFIIGGIHPSIYPVEVLKETGVDTVCVGEGEARFHEYIEWRWYSRDTKILRSISERRFDVNTLPMPAYHLMPEIEKYFQPPGACRGMIMPHGSMTVLTARGCPGKCIYCASHQIFGHKVRRRSVDSVIAEIKYLIATYGKRAISFCDDTFTVDPSWVIEFCSKLKPLGVKWNCQTRIDCITEDTLVAMKDSGCVQIDVGIESGSNKVLKILKKGISRQKYIDGIALAHKVSIRVLGTFIIGTPGEDYEDIELTKSLIRITKPDFSMFFFMYPFPGTEVKDIADECHLNTQDNFTGSGVQDFPMIADLIPPNELIQIRNELNNMVMFRNLKGYLNITALLFILSLFTPKGILTFIVTLCKRRNLYDAAYATLQLKRKHK